MLARDRVPPTAGARILALGDAASFAGPLRESGCDVTEGSGPQALDTVTEGSLDAVVAPDFIEHTQWDRWALQRIHRALKVDGHLLFTAPNLIAPFSLDAIRYLAAKATQRASRIAGRRPPPSAFTKRRYRLPRLIRTLEALAFELEAHLPYRPRGPSRLADAMLPLSWRGAWMLRCRKRPSIFGLDPRRPYPDPESHRRAFEAENRRPLEIRDEWVARHPHYRPDRAQPLDVASYRGRNILVLAPHPDDEIIGCGGTLSRLIAAGARVTAVQATDGSDGAALLESPPAVRKTIRLEEAKAVSDAIGFSETLFWREDNAAFRCREETVERLRRTLVELEPALVFTPFVTDIHPDHLELNRIFTQALETASPGLDPMQVMAYEVWSLVPANAYCDVTDVMKHLEDLLLLYVTAMKVDDFVHMCEARNYYNAHLLGGRQGFAEAFFAVSAQEYRSLVAEALARTSSTPPQ